MFLRKSAHLLGLKPGEDHSVRGPAGLCPFLQPANPSDGGRATPSRLRYRVRGRVARRAINVAEERWGRSVTERKKGEKTSKKDTFSKTKPISC